MNSRSGNLKPLQINNCQTNTATTTTMTLKDIKVTAKADSTGSENSQKDLFIKHHHSVKKMQTPSVARRNARERNRVKVVNSGFDVLKLHVPHLKNKTSKVDTLKAAVDYIRALKEMLGEEIDDDPNAQGIIIRQDSDEDSTGFSDLQDGFSPNHSLNSTTDFQDVALHPMVYQLPPSSSLPPVVYASPPPSLTSPLPSSPSTHLSSPTLTSSSSLPPFPGSSPTNNPDKIPIFAVTEDAKGDQLFVPLATDDATIKVRLPSISAPAWWPLPSSTQSQ